jgi:hypothetical protein
MDTDIRVFATCTGNGAERGTLSLRQQHAPGEKMFVDYAGATIPIHTRDDGEIQEAAIFVATLGFSSYTFAEAILFRDARSPADSRPSLLFVRHIEMTS